MSTYQELVAKKQALEKQTAELAEQIQAARDTEHADAITKIKALMASHGVSLAELGGKGGKRAKRSTAKSTTGSKVAPKYRNQATGDTWSGRGQQPKWLKAALGTGRKIEEFKI